MVRKSAIATLVAMLMVVTLIGAVFAQGAGPGAGTCVNGNDLDGDGVCDSWVDADGDGVNDFAPADGTGSRWSAGGSQPMRNAGERGPNLHGASQRGQSQRASGRGMTQGQGMTQNGAFVDANGDGQCDAYVDADGDGLNDAAPRNGAGSQHGRRGR